MLHLNGFYELLDLLLGHVGDPGVEEAEDGSHEDARHAPEIHHGAGRVLHTGQREHGQEPGAADSGTGLVGYCNFDWHFINAIINYSQFSCKD